MRCSSAAANSTRPRASLMALFFPGAVSPASPGSHRSSHAQPARTTKPSISTPKVTTLGLEVDGSDRHSDLGLYHVLVYHQQCRRGGLSVHPDRKHFSSVPQRPRRRASAAFLESFNPSYLRYIWAEGVVAIALHAMIVWAFHIPLWHYVALYASFASCGRPCSTCTTLATGAATRDQGAMEPVSSSPIDAIWSTTTGTRHTMNIRPCPAHFARCRGTRRRAAGVFAWAYLKMRVRARRISMSRTNMPGRIIQCRCRAWCELTTTTRVGRPR